jgi:peptidoglycan/LPS O-acetylase OafA/YrhL
MQVADVLYMNSFSWITALTYTKYFQKPLDKPSGHAWSLAIEEHFYLIWPIVFQFIKKWRNWFAFAVVFFVPAFRVIGGKYGIIWMNELTIFARMDALMWGCLFAIYHQPISDKIDSYYKKFKPLIVLPFLMIPALLLSQKLNNIYQWRLNALFTAYGNDTGTIADIAIGLILLISINYRNNVWYKLLNTPVLNYIGLLSYSLYLWQQLFTLTPLGILSTPPYNLIFIFAAALFSYYIIEKPFLKLKSRFKY